MKKPLRISVIVAGIVLIGALTLGAVHRTYNPRTIPGFATTPGTKSGTVCTVTAADPAEICAQIYGKDLAAQLPQLRDEIAALSQSDGRTAQTAEFTSDDGAVTIRVWHIPVEHPDSAYPSRKYALLAARVQWNRAPKWAGTDRLAIQPGSAQSADDTAPMTAWYGDGASSVVRQYMLDDAPDPDAAIQFDWSAGHGFRVPLTRGAQPALFCQMCVCTDGTADAFSVTYTHTFPGTQTNYTVTMSLS